MNDLITVVIPIYKVETFLAKCLDSVLNQTYKNLEIILVEDGSPDNCGKICDDYANKDKRIKVIHKENGGLSDARNKGINKATGKYITFIDSDDYIDDDYVECLYKTIKEDNTKMSICSHRVVYDTGRIIEKETKERTVLDSKKVLERILYDDGIDLSAWAKLYDIRLFNNVRYPKGRIYEDSATTYKLIDLCDKISINSLGKYNYIIRSDSISNNTFNPKKMDLITSTKEMTDYISDKYPDLQSACDRRLMYAHLSTLSQLANSKQKFPKEQKILVDYVKKNGKKVLKDKYTPRRDKLGIYSLKFGFGFYKFTWNIYRKLTGRKK